MRKFRTNTAKILLTLLIFGAVFGFTPKAQADHFTGQHPRLANYFLDWDITPQKIEELARWDLVVISNAAYTRYPSVVSDLRQINPDITVLVYIVSQEALTFGPTLEHGNFFREIYETANANDWWLYKGSAEKISTWPQAHWINLAPTSKTVNGQQFTDWLAQRSYERFLRDGPFDGIFYDNLFDNVTWASQEIDIDRDGQADSAEKVNGLWQQGVTKLIENTVRLAPDKIVIGNANSNAYNHLMNGRLIEHFPNPHQGHWQGNMRDYTNPGVTKSPEVFVLNANNNNVDNQLFNLQKVRYTYGSSLLGDGYYSFTIGDQTHASLWWFDEYNVFLGRAVSEPKNLVGPSEQIGPGVWNREFENGIVYINSTSEPQTVSLEADLEKIKGTQDPQTNNGAIVRQITIQPNDGIILQKRVTEVFGAVYANGSFVKPFDKYGNQIDRNGFFIFDNQEFGDKNIANIDLDGDGVREKIVADENKITITNADNTIRSVFYPYGGNYRSGINFDIGDVNFDGKPEIVTGTGRGFAPLVKIFDINGKELHGGFHAYAPSYKGGVNVALADLNGNGKKDIVVGAGYMGGPQVRIFDGTGKLVSGGFFAYNITFRGGVNVAAGDIDGDGIDEIITGAGIGGSTHVRMFNGKTQPLNPGFFAFGKESRSGVRVFVADLDGNGIDEILAANPNPF